MLLPRDPPPGSEVGCSTQKKPRDSLSNCKSSCQSVQEQYKPTNSPQISRVNSAQRVAWFHSYCLSVCCCSARRCVSCTAHQGMLCVHIPSIVSSSSVHWESRKLRSCLQAITIRQRVLLLQNQKCTQSTNLFVYYIYYGCFINKTRLDGWMNR